MRKQIGLMLFLGVFCVSVGSAFGLVVQMDHLSATGEMKSAGTVVAEQTPYGVVLTPDLKGMTPGMHGFHLHQNPSCAPAEKNGKMVPGLGAGGHYDPDGTGEHSTPWGDGHLGDLPAMTVDADGSANYPVLAPRLSLERMKGRSLMIHAGGDNYSDQPKKLGGGGMRMVCGVIP